MAKQNAKIKKLLCKGFFAAYIFQMISLRENVNMVVFWFADYESDFRFLKSMSRIKYGSRKFGKLFDYVENLYICESLWARWAQIHRKIFINHLKKVGFINQYWKKCSIKSINQFDQHWIILIFLSPYWIRNLQKPSFTKFD